MFKYVLGRIGAALLTMFLIMTLSFLVIRLMPQSLFENPNIPPVIQQMLEKQMGLDKPIVLQYVDFIVKAVTKLDFGISVKVRPGLPVWTVIGEKLGPTMLLNFFSIFICVPIGLIVGFAAALKRNTWIDSLLSFLIIIFISVPSFVFAAVLQYVFAFKFGWFPVLYDTVGDTAARFQSIILPVIALSLGPIATIGRYLRGELIENLNSEYLLLARTKGLTRTQATVKHAFRNSMIPITGTLVSMITGIMGGSLVIEKMFSVPGEGGLLTQSVSAGDHFLSVALLIFYSIISLTSMLIIDILYGVIDPRIRVGGKK